MLCRWLDSNKTFGAGGDRSANCATAFANVILDQTHVVLKRVSSLFCLELLDNKAVGRKPLSSGYGR